MRQRKQRGEDGRSILRMRPMSKQRRCRRRSQGLRRPRLNKAYRLLRVFVLVEMDDRDQCALPCHADCDSAAAADVTAGDKRDLVHEAAGATKARLELSAGLHLRFAARLVGLPLRWDHIRRGRPFSGGELCVVLGPTDQGRRSFADSGTTTPAVH